MEHDLGIFWPHPHDVAKHNMLK